MKFIFTVKIITDSILLLQIIEKSADGWWTGCVDGKEGVFPASFVEMIQIPQTKEERKKLLKRYRQGRLGEAGNNDVAGKWRR